MWKLLLHLPLCVCRQVGRSVTLSDCEAQPSNSQFPKQPYLPICMVSKRCKLGKQRGQFLSIGEESVATLIAMKDQASSSTLRLGGKGPKTLIDRNNVVTDKAIRSSSFVYRIVQREYIHKQDRDGGEGDRSTILQSLVQSMHINCR